MKKVLKTFFEVVKSYNIEEKVLSIIALAFVIYGVVKLTMLIFSGGIVLINTSYTEGYVSNRPVLISPLYTDFSNVNRDISSLVFSGLLKYNLTTKSFIGDLADLTISPDQKTYTFKLKHNVTFQDKQLLTADDIIFTYKDIIQNLNFQNPILKANFKGVKISKIDDRTVSFTIDKPNSFFITNFSVGILPKHLLQGISIGDLLNTKFNQQPVGSGPYKVLKKVTDSDGIQRIDLVINNNYYALKPKIEEIKFNIYPDEQAMSKNRAVLDVISRLNIGEDANLASDTRFQQLKYSLPQYNAVFFNTDDSILKNKKVRLGLIKSVNKAALLVHLPGMVQIDTPLMALNQKDWIYQSNAKEAAGSLFDAGYTFDKDVNGNIKKGEIYRKDKNDKMLQLTLTARRFVNGSPQEAETKTTVNFLINSWAKVGIKVNIKYLDNTDFMNTLDSKNYQMVLTGQALGYNLDTFSYWHSSQAKNGGQNLSNYRSLTADSLIERIRATLNNTDKTQKLTRLAKVIADDAPALFLDRPSFLLLTDGKVKGIKLKNLSFTADRFSEVENWCIGKSCK